MSVKKLETYSCREKNSIWGGFKLLQSSCYCHVNIKPSEDLSPLSTLFSCVTLLCSVVSSVKLFHHYLLLQTLGNREKTPCTPKKSSIPWLEILIISGRGGGQCNYWATGFSHHHLRWVAYHASHLEQFSCSPVPQDDLSAPREQEGLPQLLGEATKSRGHVGTVFRLFIYLCACGWDQVVKIHSSDSNFYLLDCTWVTSNPNHSRILQFHD